MCLKGKKRFNSKGFLRLKKLLYISILLYKTTFLQSSIIDLQIDKNLVDKIVTKYYLQIHFPTTKAIFLTNKIYLTTRGTN